MSAAADAAGAPAAASIAFIKRVGGDCADEVFAEVELVAGDSVARLAARACALFGWGPPTRARLHLVARARAAALDAGASVEAADFCAPLSALDTLAAAGVGPGACLLARVAASARGETPGGGGAPAAGLEDAVERAVARALADAALVDSLNPFAREHHSDATSPSGSVATGTSAMDRGTRRAFKASVAAFYGLAVADADVLTDMLGNERRFSDATLAHLWPASYANFSAYAREMALPPDFYTHPRNFLLLPRDVHEAFDAGLLGFVPSRDAIVVRVFRRERLSPGVAALDGTLLHLPRAAKGRVPFKRTLGWFAWLAKGAAVVPEHVQAELEGALCASASNAGNAALAGLVRRAAGARKMTL